jgi:protein gp37
MNKTPIDWTDLTWNPITGCSRCSEGCRYCYAEAIAARFSKPGLAFHGFAIMTDSGPRWTGKVELQRNRLDQPLDWRTPSRIFVNSMSDLFHPDLPEEEIAEVFDAIQKAHWHTYQILTKRAARMRDIMPRIWATFGPMPNVWLGVSVENRESKMRIDHLRRTPAAVRFLSLEPLLEDLRELNLTGMHLVIAGGESGPHARRPNPFWFRDIRDQCVEAKVPFFFKQWGHYGPLTETSEQVYPFGKKKAGRLLDGREWNELPGVSA